MSFDIKPLQSGSQAEQKGASLPLREYEINKLYKYDLDGVQGVDTFEVKTDSVGYFDLIINNKKYSLDYLTPELVYYKYKLAPIGDTGRYAFAFYPADPPGGYELVFYEFLEGSGLKIMGAASTGEDLFDTDIKYLTRNQVTVGNQTLTVLDVQTSTGKQETAFRPEAGGETLYLSELKNGDDVGGGLTIRDINYTVGGDTASFTLDGYTVLIGDIYYDHMWNCLMLKVTDDNYFSTSIIIEGPHSTMEYKPDFIAFRNEDALKDVLSSSDLNQIKNGRTFGGKIGVEDISASMQFGSEAGTSCEFVQIIDGWMNN